MFPLIAMHSALQCIFPLRATLCKIVQKKR